MLNKKIMILSLFILSLLLMSVVSATEDTNDILNSKDNIDGQLILKEECGCNVLNVDNIETKQSSSSLSFKNLNQTINVNNDSIIDLYDNYAYSEEDDDFIFGVEINREVTIDGHGITIDGANTARMFKVTTESKVVFQNINFINGYVDINHRDHYGGAIYFYKNSFAELDNCYFNNNHANMGGAVYIGLDSIVEIDNCIFMNNTAEGFIAEPLDSDDGGAIWSYGKLTRILNSKFNNNVAFSRAMNGAGGGAIYLGPWKKAYIMNCSFENNHAKGLYDIGYSYGGAISAFYTDVEVLNCNFTNNSAGADGGAIDVNNGQISNSIFLNNHADGVKDESRGGAIKITEGSITNCSFIDNTADSGNSIYATTNVTINYNAFVNSYNNNYEIKINDSPYLEVYVNLNYNWWGVNNPDFNNLIYGPHTLENWILSNFTKYGDDTEIVLSTKFNVLNNTNGVSTEFKDYYKLPVRDVYYYLNNKVIKSTTIDNVTVDSLDEILVVIVDNERFEIYSEEAGTFTDLANDIANAGDELNLTRNYVYIDKNDSNYKDGISIYKNIKINGNGFLINGNNQSRAFKLQVTNIILNNLSFINCYNDDEGGAIYLLGENLNLFNCTFINCYANYSGGAIYCNGMNSSISNCTFINSSSKTFGGAIEWIRDGYLTNCNFINCSSDNTGAVHWGSYGGSLQNCTFINCSSKCDGGAIYLMGKDSYLSGCTFINCSASNSGGAVGWGGDKGLLFNCSFVNCYSAYQGGAIFWYGTNCGGGELFNCNFVNCYSNNYGGAVYFVNPNNILLNCTFNNCSSSKYGGAIYWNGKNGLLSNCSFIKCFTLSSSFSAGGAVHWWADNGTLSKCSFVDCYSATSGGAIFWFGSNCCLLNSSFVNCSASNGGGAICWNGENGILSKCTMWNCYSSQIGGGIYVPGKNVTLSNSYFVNCVAEDNGGGIYWSGSEGILSDSCFINCTYYEIYWAGEDGQIIECNCSSCNHPIIHKSFVKINVVDNIDFNEILIVNVTVISGATGNISIYVNDSFKSNVRVCELCYLDDLQCGVNIIKAVYNGDDYYVSSENVAEVKVNKINSSIALENSIVFNYGGSNSTLAVVDGVIGLNAFVINHTEAIVNVNNNVITVSGLGAGNYTLIVIAVPDNNHLAVNTTTKIIVNKVDSSIIIPTLEFDYGESSTVNVTIDGVLEIINVVVENHPEAVICLNGTEITVSNLDVGNYTLLASTIPDNNHNAVNATAKIIVNKSNSKIEFTNNLIFDYGSMGNTLANIEYATNITNVHVENHPEAAISVNGTKIFVSNLDVGDYTLFATTVPDNNYIAVTGSTRITVNKINSTVSVTNDIIFDYGSSNFTYVLFDGATNVTAYVDNHPEATVNVVGNMINVSGLNASNYTLIVSTVPDKNHYATSIAVNIIVNKINPTISVLPVDFDYGSSGSTKVLTTDDINFISSVINHTEAIINIKNDMIYISGLDVGSYVLAVNTLPNTNYNEITITTNLTVNKIDSFIVASDIVMDYGLFGLTTVTIEGAINFKANVINHDEAIITINDNRIFVSCLDAGNYILNLTTIPDKNHNEISTNATITVNKVNSSIVIPTIEFDYNSYATVIPILDGVISINNAFVTNHKEAVINISDDNVITISGLNAGKYTLVVTSIPDKNHNAAYTTANITVNKIDSSVVVPAISFDYGLNGTTQISLNGATDFTASVNSTESVVKVESNMITVSGLDAGFYILSVTTVPDANHNAVTVIADVTVNPLTTTLSSSKVTTTYGISKNIVVTLKDSNGKFLVGKPISVKLNKVNYNAKTNVNGQAIIVVPSNLAVKTYTASITYAGETNYVKKMGSVTVVVNKATPKLTAPAKIFKVSVKTKKYIVTLKDNKNKALNKAKVTIKVNGKTFSATTNSKGQATFKITNLKKKATFKATVTYAGNSCYNKVTKTVKITCK